MFYLLHSFYFYFFTLHLIHLRCTHTVNTHPEKCAAINAAAPGEQLGVRCLAQGSHLSRGIEGGRERWYVQTVSLKSALCSCLTCGTFMP